MFDPEHAVFQMSEAALTCNNILLCCNPIQQESIELMAIPEMKYSIPFVNGSLNRAISNVITPTSVALSRMTKE